MYSEGFTAEKLNDLFTQQTFIFLHVMDKTSVLTEKYKKKKSVPTDFPAEFQKLTFGSYIWSVSGFMSTNVETEF